jgi:hypothetical protein
MPLIELPTGKTLYVSTYDYFFSLEEEDMDEFYQNCIADNLGVEIQNPFAMKSVEGKLEVEDKEETED